MNYVVLVWIMVFWYELWCSGMNYVVLVWVMLFWYELCCSDLNYIVLVWIMLFWYELWCSGMNYVVLGRDTTYTYKWTLTFRKKYCFHLQEKGWSFCLWNINNCLYHSLSLDADTCSVNHDIFTVSWRPQVHYRVHSSQLFDLTRRWMCTQHLVCGRKDGRF